MRVRGAIVATVAALTMLGPAACGDTPPKIRRATPFVASSNRLPDGLRAPAGARLLAPVLTNATRSGSWLAVMSAHGPPRAVWAGLVGQLNHRFARRHILSRSGGCGSRTGDGPFACYITLSVRLSGSTTSLQVEAKLRNPPDDITGRYVLVLTGDRFPILQPAELGTVRAIRVIRRFPPVRYRRAAPAIGDLLVPRTFDAPGYVRLAGSQMVAQWGTGSVTGGFEVLLRVLPGASANDVGAAYARQATQGEGPVRLSRAKIGRATLTSLLPPGGGGGLQGEIDVLDEPGESADFIFYSLYND